MATAQGNIHERRHTPDRRVNGGVHAARRMGTVDWIAMLLLIVGGLNWGLVGLFNFDLVAALFGEMSMLTRIVYTVVGLCALYGIYTSNKISRTRA